MNYKRFSTLFQCVKNYKIPFLAFTSFITVLTAIILFQLETYAQIFPQIGASQSTYLFLLIVSTLLYGGHLYRKNVSASTIFHHLALGFFPTFFLLALFANEIRDLHWLLRLLTGLYIIAVGTAILLQSYSLKISSLRGFAKQSRKFLNRSPRRGLLAMTKKSGFIWLAILLIMLLHFSFGAYMLEQQAIVDEGFWLENRIVKYWGNIGDMEFAKTTPSDKPGVTVAALSGLGLTVANPTIFEIVKGDALEFMLFAMRLPILLFATLTLPLWFLLLRNLIGRRSALFATLFIGLSPILLGMARIINPDSLLWICIPLTFLAYLNFKSSSRPRYLFLTGILLGFSLLTKYVANILFIFFLLWPFAHFALQDKKDPIEKFMRRFFQHTLTLWFLALSVFYLLLPSVWIKPYKLFDATLGSQAFDEVWPYYIGILLFLTADLLFLKSAGIGKVLSAISRYRTWIARGTLAFFLALILFTLINTLLGMPWIDFNSIMESPKRASPISGIGPILFYISQFYPLLFGISTLALAFMLIPPLLSVRSRSLSSQTNITLLAIVLFIFLFYLGATISEISATVRYQIALYPLAFILSGMGAHLFYKRFFPKRKRVEFIVLFAFILLFSVWSLWMAKPHYFSFASILLPHTYILNVKDMGDGSYEAAQYLNALPEATSLVVWSDKSGVCDFFVGVCLSGNDYRRYMEEGWTDRFKYYIVSSGRENRTTDFVLRRLSYNPDYLVRFDLLYPFRDTEWIIHPAGREANYVKIISASKIDISYEQDPHKPEL